MAICCSKFPPPEPVCLPSLRSQKPPQCPVYHRSCCAGLLKCVHGETCKSRAARIITLKSRPAAIRVLDFLEETNGAVAFLGELGRQGEQGQSCRFNRGLCATRVEWPSSVFELTANKVFQAAIRFAEREVHVARFRSDASNCQIRAPIRSGGGRSSLVRKHGISERFIFPFRIRRFHAPTKWARASRSRRESANNPTTGLARKLGTSILFLASGSVRTVAQLSNRFGRHARTRKHTVSLQMRYQPRIVQVGTSLGIFRPAESLASSNRSGNGSTYQRV